MLKQFLKHVFFLMIASVAMSDELAQIASEQVCDSVTNFVLQDAKNTVGKRICEREHGDPDCDWTYPKFSTFEEQCSVNHVHDARFEVDMNYWHRGTVDGWKWNDYWAKGEVVCFFAADNLQTWECKFSNAMIYEAYRAGSTSVKVRPDSQINLLNQISTVTNSTL